MSDRYLLPEYDELKMRKGREYTKNKLEAVEHYLGMFSKSMKNKRWRSLNYIDLQSGPGKVSVRGSEQVLLGSPLLALTSEKGFSRYFFVDNNQDYVNDLSERVSVSERANQVDLRRGDCNTVVNDIVKKLKQCDKIFLKGKWSSLNLAFLDPEGLELHWSTVEKLASVNHMDLIINFSTSGFTRNAKMAIEMGNTETIDRFFGTIDWKETYSRVSNEDGNRIRREMLDFYKGNLVALGYQYVFDDLVPDELVVKNIKGVQLYTLFGVSKHKLGGKFWQESISQIRGQKKLF